MSNIVVNIDNISRTGIDKTGEEVKKSKHFVDKIFRVISVDADNFCESKDWPYLWPGKDRKNRS